MTTPFLFHGQDQHWVTIKDDSLLLRLATELSQKPKKIYARCEPDNEQKLIEMQPVEQRGRLQYWQAEIPIAPDKATTLYCFKAVFSDKQYWLHAAGISKRASGQETHFRFNAKHQPPSWVKQQIFYQIFPDRFANGNPEISVTSGEYFLHGELKPALAKTWDEAVSPHGKTGASEFYGGDLKGIRDKLDYLQQLGVTSLYLNPIFTAPSNHKYDTSDYFAIDPHLGTNQEFADFVADLHQRGMKIVLDAVYNHTSLNHPWFDRFGKREDGLGAWQNPNSPYRDFYQFEGDSENYVGWNGIASLPKLNFLNERVRDYFYHSEQAVIKHWLRPPYQIDGWRFDVIHMLGEGKGAVNNAHYVKAFREAAKSVNPDCYVLGEHFFEASNWLQGEQEDGAMNYYGFAHPVRAFFAGLDISFDPCELTAEDFVAWLMEAMAKVPWQNQLSQLNQLDSHDTMRFLTMLRGDEQSLRNALIMLFCWVGVPCLYYGTEVRLEGGHDPDNRRTFPWQRLNSETEMREFIQTLTHFRQQSNALQQGSVHWLYAKQKAFAFARFIGDERVICAINQNEASAMMELPLWQLAIDRGSFSDLLTNQSMQVIEGKLQLALAGKSAVILKKS